LRVVPKKIGSIKTYLLTLNHSGGLSIQEATLEIPATKTLSTCYFKPMKNEKKRTFCDYGIEFGPFEK